MTELLHDEYSRKGILTWGLTPVLSAVAVSNQGESPEQLPSLPFTGSGCSNGWIFPPGPSEEFLQTDEHSPGHCPPVQAQLSLLPPVPQWQSGTQARPSCDVSIHKIQCKCWAGSPTMAGTELLQLHPSLFPAVLFGAFSWCCSAQQRPFPAFSLTLNCQLFISVLFFLLLRILTHFLACYAGTQEKPFLHYSACLE